MSGLVGTIEPYGDTVTLAIPGRTSGFAAVEIGPQGPEGPEGPIGFSQIPVGTVSLPGLPVTSDPDTGFYSSGANSLSLVTGGIDRLRVASNGDIVFGGGTGTGVSSILRIEREHTVNSDGHGVTDLTVFNPGGTGNAYASYDTLAVTAGTADYNHNYGFQARNSHTSSGTLATLGGFISAIDSTGGAVTDMAHFRAVNGTTTGPVTNQYAFYSAPLVGATNNYGVYIAGNNPSHFGGDVTLARTLGVTMTLAVTGASTLTGNVGIGGASATTAGLTVASAALSTNTQRGINSAPVFTSAATSTIAAFVGQLKSAAASFSTASGYGLQVVNASLGAGHTLTTQVGVQVDSLTAGGTNVAIRTSGTNDCRFGGSITVGIATQAATASVDVNGDTIRLRTAKTPASAGATGSTGMLCWDADYAYVCTGTNTWKRVALSTW